jgi:Sugar (and other) transporter
MREYYAVPLLNYTSGGRRSMIITGGSAIAGCMLTIGSIYASKGHLSFAGRWAIITLINLAIISFSMFRPLAIRIYASEIQPARTRAAASSLGQAVNGIINWVVAFTTPFFLSRSMSGPYFLFGACSALTALVCLAFVPESQGVNLERLDEVFKTSPPWHDIVARLGFEHWFSNCRSPQPTLGLVSGLRGDPPGSRSPLSDNTEMKSVSVRTV